MSLRPSEDDGHVWPNREVAFAYYRKEGFLAGHLKCRTCRNQEDFCSHPQDARTNHQCKKCGQFTSDFVEEMGPPPDSD